MAQHARRDPELSGVVYPELNTWPGLLVEFWSGRHPADTAIKDKAAESARRTVLTRLANPLSPEPAPQSHH